VGKRNSFFPSWRGQFSKLLLGESYFFSFSSFVLPMFTKIRFRTEFVSDSILLFLPSFRQSTQPLKKRALIEALFPPLFPFSTSAPRVR